MCQKHAVKLNYKKLRKEKGKKRKREEGGGGNAKGRLACEGNDTNAGPPPEESEIHCIRNPDIASTWEAILCACAAISAIRQQQSIRCRALFRNKVRRE